MKTRREIQKRHRNQSGGFSLVEVAIAVGVAAFCLVAMLGLLPTGMKSVKAAVDQTAATAFLGAVVNDVRNASSQSALSPMLGIAMPSSAGGSTGSSPGSTNFQALADKASFGAPISTTLFLDELGNRVGADDPGARYEVAVSLSNSAFNTLAMIRVRWPARSEISNSQGMVEAVTAVSR
jgi:type II secretory pathway pseudopilin PulG